jgi:hypothetical protein
MGCSLSWDENPDVPDGDAANGAAEGKYNCVEL